MQHCLRQIKDLQPGDHLCLIYETVAEHRAVLTRFFRQGLELGDKVIYVVDARTGETVLGYLQDDGVDTDAHVQRGQLVILAVDDAYMREGVFHPDGMIQLLRAETEKAMAEGYRALRFSAEMSWGLRGLPGSECLMEYEAKLNDFLPGNQCLAVCQYDRGRFTPDLLLEVLATHPIAVLGVEVIDNIYYIPPDELLGPDADAARLTNWIRNLQDRKRIEENLQSRAIKLDERLQCLYRIADLVEEPGISLSTLLQRVVDLIPLAWQYPEISGASISLEGAEFRTKDFKATSRQLASAIKVEGREAGMLQVYYLEEKTPAEEGPVQGEERQLIDAIAERLGRVIERLRAEGELRSASTYARSLIEASLDPLVTISADGKIMDVNKATEEATGVMRERLIGRDFSDYFTEPDKARAGYQQVLAEGFVRDYPLALRHTSGRIMEVLYNATIYKNAAGGVEGVFAAARDITERKRAVAELQRISWLLRPKSDHQVVYEPAYGDPTKLNTSRVLLDAIGQAGLTDTVGYFISLLGTSSAVYEKNGDYAVGIFSSGWCQLLDQASYRQCHTDDLRQALACGQWHCHESCWTKASKVAMETRQATDIECDGGIRLYTVPIWANGEIVGAINCGYGDPPRDPRRLAEIAAKYGVTVEELRQEAAKYETRPPFIIEIAKDRLLAAARLMGTMVERKRAEEALRRSMAEIVQAMALTVEIRDPHTSGHQRRVTQLAQAIGVEMNLPQEQLEGLWVAGTLHDLGKIYVPEGILSRPGRLSNIEFSIVQTHCQKGFEILQPIEFPWPIAEIVRQHHERLNGSGYPKGLKGEEILFEARILAVADVVEAMSSHRPYRPALGIDAALAEITKNKGKLYDPEVVDACVKLFTEKGFIFE